MKSNAQVPGGPVDAVHADDAVTSIAIATSAVVPDQPDALARARAFAEPLIAGEHIDTGENILAHADAVAAILKAIGRTEALQAAIYLVHSCEHLARPLESITKAFGANYAALAAHLNFTIWKFRANTEKKSNTILNKMVLK